MSADVGSELEAVRGESSAGGSTKKSALVDSAGDEATSGPLEVLEVLESSGATTANRLAVECLMSALPAWIGVAVWMGVTLAVSPVTGMFGLMPLFLVLLGVLVPVVAATGLAIYLRTLGREGGEHLRLWPAVVAGVVPFGFGLTVLYEGLLGEIPHALGAAVFAAAFWVTMHVVGEVILFGRQGTDALSAGLAGAFRSLGPDSSRGSRTWGQAAIATGVTTMLAGFVGGSLLLCLSVAAISPPVFLLVGILGVGAGIFLFQVNLVAWYARYLSGEAARRTELGRKAAAKELPEATASG